MDDLFESNRANLAEQFHNSVARKCLNLRLLNFDVRSHHERTVENQRPSNKIDPVKSLRAYHLICLFFTFYLFLHLGIIFSGSLGEWRDPHYPLSLWKMWAHVPSLIELYDIEISIDGDHFKSWKEIEYLRSTANQGHTQYILGGWVRSLNTDDPKAYNKTKKFMEGRLLLNQPAKYRLISILQNPQPFGETANGSNEKLCYLTKFQRLPNKKRGIAQQAGQ